MGSKYIKITTDEEGNYYIDDISPQPKKYYTEIDEKNLEEMRKIIKEYEAVQDILSTWYDERASELSHDIAKGIVK